MKNFLLLFALAKLFGGESGAKQPPFVFIPGGNVPAGGLPQVPSPVAQAPAPESPHAPPPEPQKAAAGLGDLISNLRAAAAAAPGTINPHTPEGVPPPPDVSSWSPPQSGALPFGFILAPFTPELGRESDRLEPTVPQWQWVQRGDDILRKEPAARGDHMVHYQRAPGPRLGLSPMGLGPFDIFSGMPH